MNTKLNSLILSLVLLAGCQTVPTNPEYWVEKETNACLPTAILFKQSLTKYGVWSRVLTTSYIDMRDQKNHGHALVAYLYPAGKNMLWTYDAEGSYQVRAYKDNPSEVAKKAFESRGQSRTLLTATYLED